MYLLVIFDHFGINVIALFIDHIDLMVQFFAHSLQTETGTYLLNPAVLWLVAQLHISHSQHFVVSFYVFNM